MSFNLLKRGRSIRKTLFLRHKVQAIVGKTSKHIQRLYGRKIGKLENWQLNTWPL